MSDTAVILGAIPLTLLSVLTYWMAGTNGFRQHGREAGYVWATLGMMIVLTRLLDTADIIGTTGVRNILSVSYLSALVILVQIQFIINGGRH